MTTKLKLPLLAAAALACTLAGAGRAAEIAVDAGSKAAADSTPDSSAAADPAASDEASSSPATPPAPPVKPRPAELMPKAAQSLMLGLANTGEHLIAVGDRGEILASKDGKSWAQVPTPVRSPLTAVTFVDAQNGWAVGHDAAIVHSADGGRTWTLQNFQPELEKPFLGVLFLDSTHGFAVGAYGLFDETTDGGTHWTEVKADAVRGDELHLYSLAKLGNGDLLVAGEQGTLGLSSDSGKTWKKITSPYEGTLFGAVPVGERGALLCGLRGHAYLTQDARAGKWQTLETGTTASLFGCAADGPGRAVMVGLNGLVMTVDTKSGKVETVDSGLDGALSAGIASPSGGLVVAGELGVAAVAAPAAVQAAP